ncbi:unnamed protein product, partial [Polarella glacialis]
AVAGLIEAATGPQSVAATGVGGRKGKRHKPRRSLPAHSLSGTDREKLLASVDLFVFDCDGVIWRGDSLIEGVSETLAFLRKLGKTIVFVTNNSTRSRKQYAAKFRKLGLDWVREENIFSSSFAAAAYLSSLDFRKKVYVIGEEGILEGLKGAGIEYLGGPADAGKVVDLAAAGGAELKLDADVGAVVVGFDRHLNYHKLQYATKCLRELPDCHFVATNLDAVTHLTADDEWAGGGSMVAAVAASSQKQPVLVGKPSQFMTEFLIREYGVSPDRMCMVGDRLDTDILFGQAGGMQTLLVLSGVTSEKTLKGNKGVFPDHYAPSLASLGPSSVKE